MSDRAAAHRGRRRGADLYLGFAIVVALAPATLLAVGATAAQAGLSDWRAGLGLFILDWAPRLALIGVATGALALVTALLAGFRRYWRRALLALAITAITLSAYVWNARSPSAEMTILPGPGRYGSA